jgi:hypothetical protein
MKYKSNEISDTLEGMIEIIKTENPTLRVGNEEDGYVELSAQDYDKIILQWANARFEKIKNYQSKIDAKTKAQTKLAALGLTVEDLQALGL